MAQNQEQDLQTEEDFEEESPHVEFDISVSPSDPTLSLLAKQLDDKDIIIPFYQRKFVWKIERASKLIESFLMGLPVPQIFLYINNDEILEVIDGQQRLLSIKYFFDGFFGEADSSGKRQVFKLKGLSERSEYNGKEFSELSEKDQRKLKNSTLRAINIRQLKPKSEINSVFYIFERLNTGGVQLKAQEIRNAVYRGEIVNKLQKLNNNQDWRNILGLNQPAKNQKDIELILRIFSLYKNWENYEKPMISFLNRSMNENRDFSSNTAKEFEEKFPQVTSLIHRHLKKPFRPKNVINSAVLESVIVTLMENNLYSEGTLAEKYKILMDNEQFSNSTRGSTTDTNMLLARMKIAKSILINEQD